MIKLSIEPQAIYLNEKREVDLQIKNCGSELCTNIHLKLQVSPAGLLLEKRELEKDFLDANEVCTRSLLITANKPGDFRLEITYFSYLANGRVCRPSISPLILKVIEFPLLTPLDGLDSKKTRLNQDKRHTNDKTVILFVAADPKDQTKLRLGEEIREIAEKLRLATLRDNFILNQRLSVRPTDLTQALLDENPRIVHFSGHGLGGGKLCFEDKNGNTHPVSPDALAGLFREFADIVQCILLNACFSNVLAEALAKHIDYVIGMHSEINDDAAIAFTTGFYQALGAGRTIEQAYRIGCEQIRLENFLGQHHVPVLMTRNSL
ncbi:MAG: CHAT domain-containing protein [Caldilineaceae bacterium]